MTENIDQYTVDGFGYEWKKFDQSELYSTELEEMFNCYFSIFPQNILTKESIGFDLGCGSGKWAKCVAPKVGLLHCIDASEAALQVAMTNLSHSNNCEFYQASVDSIPLEDASMDFGYSLGVLHHVPNTLDGIKACVAKLKPGAPFLIYLYYAFDNKPFWVRNIWQLSDIMRSGISRLPN